MTADPATKAPIPTPAADVRCPLCDYDLRGLAEPRCPECGFRFEWADLTDPARRVHRYLFEHHPQRNVWSFFRTVFAGFVPARFWSSIHPAQRSRLLRLGLYWALALVPLVVVVASYYGLWFAQATATTSSLRAINTASVTPSQRAALSQQYGSYNQFLDEFYPLPPSRRFFSNAWQEEGWWTIHLATFWVVWPLLLFVTMLLFRISMRRARIRPVHMLRCVLYSYDAVFWLAPPLAAAVALKVLNWYGLFPSRMFLPTAPIPRNHIWQYRPEFFTDILFWGGLVLVILTAYRLTVALRHYLRFDHAVATVLAAHVIAAMLLVIAVARHWVP